MVFDSLWGLFSSDLAIDLGTANTVVYVKGKGIVSSEPSVVAIQRDSRGEKHVLAVGMVRRLVSSQLPRHGDARESGRSAGRRCARAEGWFLSLSPILLQPLSRGRADFEYTGQFHNQYQLSLRARCLTI